jgi:hypothetical protein
MDKKKLYNVLENFDLRLLDNPEFKEDSVREEIVLPIIKSLGYSIDQPNQIIRSRNLLHPFVSIGSQKRKIYIIPDYLFEVNKKPAWILDAKSPTESIIKSANVEQAYSYAIHSEVRVKFFALCNGKEFVLYSIDEVKPLLHFEIRVLPLFWESLKQILAPQNVLSKSNLEFAKDLGLHLKRLGFDKFESLIFHQVPITNITQLDENMFTINAGSITIEDTRYLGTFDFSLEILEQFVGKTPQEAIDKLLTRDSNGRVGIQFGDTSYFVNLDCSVGEKLEENDKEIFLPIKINRVF